MGIGCVNTVRSAFIAAESQQCIRPLLNDIQSYRPPESSTRMFDRHSRYLCNVCRRVLVWKVQRGGAGHVRGPGVRTPISLSQESRTTRQVCAKPILRGGVIRSDYVSTRIGSNSSYVKPGARRLWGTSELKIKTRAILHWNRREE